MMSVTPEGKDVYVFGDVALATRTEAEAVIGALRNQISERKLATVGDLYVLTGITSTFRDDMRGWSDLSEASIREVDGRYLLELPEPKPLS